MITTIIITTIYNHDFDKESIKKKKSQATLWSTLDHTFEEINLVHGRNPLQEVSKLHLGTKLKQIALSLGFLMSASLVGEGAAMRAIFGEIILVQWVD